MCNIFFALIALGALSIDIILNRYVIEEIRDEGEGHKKKIEKTFKKVNWKDAEAKREASSKSRDKAEVLINKLELEAKKRCANNRARRFYFTVFILAIGVVVSVVMDVFNGRVQNEIFSCFYDLLGVVGTIAWVSILIFYMYQLAKALQFSYYVDGKRQKITDMVQQTILNAKIIGKDPTFPFDEEKQ